jgi:3-dehydroquinate dehydratase/shikimate dehydrogenase
VPETIVTRLNVGGRSELASPFWPVIHGCELRLDLLTEIPLPTGVAGEPPWRVVSCRRARDGGRFEGSEEERAALLRPYLDRAGEIPFLDVEWDGPFRDWIQLYPDRGFILSYHCLEETPPDLEEIWNEMRRWPANRFKIVTRARSWQDVAAMKTLLADATRRGLHLTACCTGPLGPASRLLGLVWGSGMMYVSEGEALVPGMLTLREYAAVYRAGRAGPASRIYGVVGDPVQRSLSPLWHNWFFECRGSPDLYVPLPAPDLEDFRRALPVLAPAGLSVTAPHKEHVLPLCEELSPEAERLGAVNTLTAVPGGWHGDNTDWTGFQRCLEGWLPADRNRFLLLGAGGTARAILYALERRGADVWCWNRDPGRLDRLRKDFPNTRPAAAPFPPVDTVVNATSSSGAGKLPLLEAALESLPADFALDVAYGGRISPFLEHARRRGWAIQDGLAMLFYQAVAQHRRWTGADPPVAWPEARRLAEEHMTADIRSPQNR